MIFVVIFSPSAVDRIDALAMNIWPLYFLVRAHRGLLTKKIVSKPRLDFDLYRGSEKYIRVLI